MANSASDARSSEQDIRQKLIEAKGVDVMIAVSSNFFYTVTLPCSLWFFDKAKKGTDREDKVLFIDARHIFRQVTRAVRDYTSEQLNFIANIVRLYRGEGVDNTYLEQHPDEVQGSTNVAGDRTSGATQANNGDWAVDKHFPEGLYEDIAGLCRVATIEEIKEQGWSLNPGRYVGVAAGEEEHDEDFVLKLEALQEELEVLNSEAHSLEKGISLNLAKILGVM